MSNPPFPRLGAAHRKPRPERVGHTLCMAAFDQPLAYRGRQWQRFTLFDKVLVPRAIDQLDPREIESLIQEGKECHQPVPSDIGCVPERARSRYSTVYGAYLQHSGRLPVTRGHFSTAR